MRLITDDRINATCGHQGKRRKILRLYIENLTFPDMKKPGLLILILIGCFGFLAAQPTLKQTINSNWEFHKGDVPGLPANTNGSIKWETISLPHSWNTVDVNQDTGYYRGIGWYKKTIYAPASWRKKSIYLYFEGANQVAEVYINGKLAGKHIGGYTAFSFDIGKLLQYNSDGLTANQILVKLDNRANENIPPLDADFTFFGGIYRDVYLISADPVHFNVDVNAASGVRVKAPAVSGDEADVAVESSITNTSAAKLKVVVSSSIEDSQGNLIKEVATNATLSPGNTTLVI